MKIWQLLVLFALLAVNAAAQDFPGPFVVNGAPVSNLVIVVGDTAPASDVVAAVKIVRAFYPDTSNVNSDEKVQPLPTGVTRLSSEVDDISNYNSIVLGTDCYNPITAHLLNNPIQCGQSSGLKLIKHSNGNVALLIMGTPEEIRDYTEKWISGQLTPVQPVSQPYSFSLKIGETFIVVANRVEYKMQLTDISGDTGSFDVNGEIFKLSSGEKYVLADGAAFVLNRFSAGNFAEIYMEDVTSVYLYTGEPGECTDSDGGRTPWQKGSVCIGDVCHHDYCEGNTLHEQYCSSGQVIESPGECSQGFCAYGACHPAGTEVKPPAETSEAVPHPETAPVAVVPEQSCDGCSRDSQCLAYGIRFLENDKPIYCDIDGALKSQKSLDESCQNNYECASNSCSGKCISVEERLQAVEKELKEQRSLIEKIMDFFKSIFGG